jgi:CBS domain containing-hemolysin-like protein
MMNFVYIAVILALMILSFLFSGSETGVYRLSRFRLRVGAEQKRKPFVHLNELIKDGHNLILALLLGNNLVNYLMTALFTIFLYQTLQNEHTAEFYTSVILTPVVFIFCEMVPKSIFYHKSDVLLPPLSGILRFIYLFFMRTGLLQIFKFLFALNNRLLSSKQNTIQAVDKTQRLQVYQIIHETQEEGLLSDVQKDMIHRLINIPDISVGSVMIPLAEFGKVSLNAGRQELLTLLRNGRFPHPLIYETSPDHITGYISLLEVLGRSEPVALCDFVKPLASIDRSASVIEAISLLRNKREKMAIVTETSKDHSRPIGVITLTDLIEQLTREIKL